MAATNCLLWRRVSSRRLYWAILPRLYVYFRRRRRMRRIREALPDALDMLSMCVSGGLELGESLEQVARRLIAYPECAHGAHALEAAVGIGKPEPRIG